MTFTPSASGALWQARQSETSMVAVGAWLDGLPAGDGLRSRLTQAWNSLGSGAGQPVLVAVEFRLDSHVGPLADRTLVDQVLKAQETPGGLALQASSLSWRR
jgi:hypothetical protein